MPLSLKTMSNIVRMPLKLEVHKRYWTTLSKHREQERISMDKVLVGRKSVSKAKVQFQLRSKILFFSPTQ